MSLKITGSGSPSGATMSVYGDGEATSIEIDLSKSPFNIDFRGLFPSVACLDAKTLGGQPDLDSVSIDRDKLTLTFESAPDSVDLTLLSGSGQPSPRIELTFEFIY